MFGRRRLSFFIANVNNKRYNGYDQRTQKENILKRHVHRHHLPSKKSGMQLSKKIGTSPFFRESNRHSFRETSTGETRGFATVSYYTTPITVCQ
jgi:hypothetical protein